MTYTCFHVEIADKIAHIQLKRAAEMNTMTRDFWNELPEIVKDIDHNAKARVIIISSTGKHFSAGMDLSVFTAPSGATNAKSSDPAISGEEARLNLINCLQETFNCLDFARIPVLMACQGGVIGGAVDFASACDMRYASADAFFCIQETNIGMTADVGTFPRLCKIIPEGWVREMAYTGCRLPAQKAKEIGLVNEVYDTQEAMLEAVFEKAREIASKNPLAITGSKVMINYARDHSVRDGLEYIATWNFGMFPPHHMAEAFAAKAEKREANFPDLKPLRTKF